MPAGCVLGATFMAAAHAPMPASAARHVSTAGQMNHGDCHQGALLGEAADGQLNTRCRSPSATDMVARTGFIGLAAPSELRVPRGTVTCSGTFRKKPRHTF